MIPAIISLLKASPAVSVLVNDRIHAGRAPQAGALPDIVIVKTGEQEAYDLGGAAGAVTARLTVICRGERFSQAYELGGAVVAALRYLVIDGMVIQRGDIDATDIVSDGRDVHLRMLGFVAWNGE